MRSLNRLAIEVSSRVPAYLEPVSQKGVPLEVKPVIDEVKKLLLRLKQAFDREKDLQRMRHMNCVHPWQH